MKRFLFLTVLLTLVVAAPAAAREDNDTAIIPASSDTSEAKDLKDMGVVGIKLPASMDGANITAECAVGSVQAADFGALYQADGTTQWSIPFNANRFIDLTQQGKAIYGCRFVRFVSDSTESAAVVFKLQLAD